MTPSEFNAMIKNFRLTQNEFSEAWKIFKQSSPQNAVDYVQKIHDKRIQFQSSLKLRDTAVPYHIWGAEHIESGALDQMEGAARLPIALAGSLMPDAHKGYGLPIGGVLATENAVVPYAVGVDIACRMMMTVYQAPVCKTFGMAPSR